MYSLTMPFVDPMFHCTRLQHTLLHHTIPFYTSFIFVYITTAPSSRNSSLHHLTSGCNRDLLAMSYSDIIVLHYTSPCCIVLMLSRYLLQSWPTTTSSNVLLHVIKQCWTVLHHAGSYSFQGDSSAFKCTCLLHFSWPPVLLWLLHAILLSVGAYGCTLTHGACCVWWCT